MSRDERGEGTLEIRDATDADVEFLMELARVAYLDVVTRQFGRWEEDVHGKRYLEKIGEAPFGIIVLNGVRVGTVHAREEDSRFVLGELVVHPDHQGQGIGAWALTRVLRQARARGKPLSLHTMHENHRARAFYRRHGFVETNVGDNYVEMEAR